MILRAGKGGAAGAGASGTVAPTAAGGADIVPAAMETSLDAAGGRTEPVGVVHALPATADPGPAGESDDALTRALGAVSLEEAAHAGDLGEPRNG